MRYPRHHDNEDSHSQLLEEDYELQRYESGNSSGANNHTPSANGSSNEELGLNQADFTNKVSKSTFFIIVAAILLSNFSAAVDTGLSASTHTTVAASFNHTNLQAWPVNAFVLASMIVQPLYGRFSDVMGRKIPYVTASCLFSLGIAASSVAPTWEVLIAARALCGIGSAGVTTMGSVVLTDTVGLSKRGYYQSLNYAVYGGGTALGSACGGSIVELLGWGWIYKWNKLQLPITLLALSLLSWVIPAKLEPVVQSQKHRLPLKSILRNFDWQGSIYLMVTLLCLFILLTMGGNLYPWGHPFVLLAAIATVIAAGLFIFTEKKKEYAVLPLYLLMNFPSRNVMLTGFLTSFINYSVLYNTTLFFQTVLLDSVHTAGFRLLIPSVSYTLASCLTGVIIARRKSPLLTLRLGQLFLCLGTIGLVVMASAFRTVSIAGWTYNIMLSIPIIGVGMLASSTVLTLLHVTPSADQAVATGGLIMVRSLGVFTATAISGAILQNIFLLVLRPQQLDKESALSVEAVREDASKLLEMAEPLKSQVIASYEKAFTAVYGTCAVAAIILIASLSCIQRVL